MPPQNLKPIGIACFIICAICLFVAVERYQTNAANINALNGMTQSMPLGQPSPFGQLQPGTPVATKYGLLFAFISGIGGVVCFAKSGQNKFE